MTSSEKQSTNSNFHIQLFSLPKPLRLLVEQQQLIGIICWSSELKPYHQARVRVQVPGAKAKSSPRLQEKRKLKLRSMYLSKFVFPVLVIVWVTASSCCIT